MAKKSEKMTHGILIRKASGVEELFDVHKLERSLKNAGAANSAIKKIVANIESWIVPGMSTRKIYSRAFSMLRRRKTPAALRYRVKRAMLELGPTGYPFETFIGQLFEKLGFETEVGVTVEGHCVTHEMDVIATQEKKQYLVECKYRMDQGNQISVQTPLYVRSRVDDIIRKREKMTKYQGLSFTGWLVTNTRFSSDSIKYGTCSGLHLLGWDYPRGKGLQHLIQEEKFYPITVLTGLPTDLKKYMLENGIVTCSQLWHNLSIMDGFELPPVRRERLLKELDELCG